MIDAAARRSDPIDGRDVGLAIAAPVLILLGYYVISDVRVSAAAAAAMVMLAWGVVAFFKPRFALAASVPLLLLAGTKFRTRFADATLDGVLDAQVVFELALFAFVGIAVIAVALATRTVRRVSTAEALIIGYTGIALLSTLWSAEPMLTLVRAAQLAVVAGLAIVAVRVLTPAGALWTTARALAGYVLLCSLAAAALPWTTLPLFPDEGVFRFRWFATHPLDAATQAGAAAVVVLGVIACARTGSVPMRAGIGMRLLLVALLTLVVITSSRGPMVALAAAAGFVWLRGMRPAVRGAAAIAAAVCLLAVLAYASEIRSWADGVSRGDSVAARLFFRGQTTDDVLALNGRLELWDEVRPIVLDHLAAGTGYQASRAALLDVAEWAAYAHNALLQTVLDVGIVGLLTMVSLIVLGFRAGGRAANPPWVRVAAPALVLFLILNSMSNESFAAAPDIELLLVFVCALCGAAAGRRPA